MDESKAESSSSKLPKYVNVTIEVPKGSFVKRRPDGSVDFIGLFPCPFNYGSVRSIPAPDGDPLDALVLGESIPYGTETVQSVSGIIKFTDAGLTDNKLVCTASNIREAKRNLLVLPRNRRSSFIDAFLKQGDEIKLIEFCGLTSFFGAYALFKRALNAVRGRRGKTAFHGFEIL